jgi:hypothetical protein
MRGLGELDPRTDGDAAADPCCEKSCALRIHTRDIGFETLGLYPPQPRDGRRRPGVAEVATGRRIAPNSTA